MYLTPLFIYTHYVTLPAYTQHLALRRQSNGPILL